MGAGYLHYQSRVLSLKSGIAFDFSKKTYLMGVVNATPDSFSGDGLFNEPEKAVGEALRMTSCGADIIDIGGESTRPGSEPVSPEEEMRRVLPIIKGIRKSSSVPISIDTYKSQVARMALDEGADIINDISGLRFDPEMAGLAAQTGAPVILMHIKGTPRDMQKNPVYKALIPEIMDYLRGSIWKALDAGVAQEKIIIDPGIGFGKTFAHNLEILKNLSEFAALEKPILIGVSRKAFIGHILGGAPPSERLEGTLAALAIAVANGADIVRVHDVEEAAKAVKVADAIRRAVGAISLLQAPQ
jgi:dihydropteroate synthase